VTDKLFSTEGDWREQGITSVTVGEWSDTVRLDVKHGDSFMSPDTARLVALALIRAADAAESSE